MTTEIKIQYAQVEQALADMKSSIQNIEPTFPIKVGGDNVLDVVTKLHELNAKLETANKRYQEILVLNEELTRKSVEHMKETDEHISTAIAD